MASASSMARRPALACTGGGLPERSAVSRASACLSKGVIGEPPDYYQYNTWQYDDRLIVPALAIPVQGKSSFEVPSSHKAALSVAFGKVGAAITIGWRGLENDFVQLWEATTGGLTWMCVSGDEEASRETIMNIGSNGLLDSRPGVRRAFSGGFKDLLLSGELRSFLQTCAH